jgi:aquaporin Z
MLSITETRRQVVTPAGAIATALEHWPEYLMEAALLGIFMVSACVFGVLLEHPSSPIPQLIESGFARRVIAGIAMGLTLIGIVYSPWGQRSGAHLNPSVTLTFYSLGKIDRWDAVFYLAFQFLGGIGGVVIAELLIGAPLRHDAVNYVVTVPGPDGAGVALLAEVFISFLMMTTVLLVSNTPKTTRFTGVFAGVLLASFITFVAPISGVSLNPARTFGSAVAANEWSSFWVYLVAPPIAMLAAGRLYAWRSGIHAVFCAKLDHHNQQRCIFRCNYGAIHDK